MCPDLVAQSKKLKAENYYEVSVLTLTDNVISLWCQFRNKSLIDWHYQLLN